MNRARGWTLGFVISAGLWILIIWLVMEIVEMLK
jgi:hypothetical protein